MRPQKVLDIDIINGLAEVFRSKGYDGTSLAELADATNLKKASLYHRFPGGKEEMANAVLNYINDWVVSNILDVLMDDSYESTKRLKLALDNVRILYDYGNKVCVFKAFSMKSGLELFEEQIATGMTAWINAFKQIGIALKLKQKEAESYAEQTFVEIQGSLIVAKGMGNLNVFENALKRIESRYLKK